jgi:hypothetical protein
MHTRNDVKNEISISSEERKATLDKIKNAGFTKFFLRDMHNKNKY